MVTTTPEPTITVVLATYNGERFLHRQLESIFTQTSVPREIIVSDDGSTDSTLEILKSFQPAAKEKGVSWRIVQRDNPLGPAQNFWSAIALATSDLIALADQDDLWYPEKLATLAASFRREPDVLMVHSDADIIDPSGHPVGELFDSLRLTFKERRALREGRGFSALMRRNVVTGMTVMMRKNLFERAGDLPDHWIHDEWLALVAGLHGGLRTNFRKLAGYRQHGENSIGAHKISFLGALQRLFVDRKDYYWTKRLRAHQLEGLLKKTGDRPSSDAISLLQHKVDFMRWQTTLPDARLLRVGPVFLRWVRGDYSANARGTFDALRDVLSQ